MPIAETNDSNLIKEIETKRGAKVGYRTVSTFYADSQGNICDLGVFLYECQDSLWYEDFEPEASIFGFKIQTKAKSKYVKFEGSFRMEDVVSVRRVLKRAARRCACGERSFAGLRAAGVVSGFLCAVVTEFVLRDGRRLYFELLDNSVIDIIKKHSKVM